MSSADGTPSIVPSYGDLRVIALGFGSWPLWTLGWPDTALGRVRQAAGLARDLGDPFNLAFALIAESVGEPPATIPPPS